MSSSNVSSVVKHFPQANEGFITTLGSTILSGAATVPLTTTSGLTNGSVFVGIIEPGVVGKEQTFTGTVDTSGTQITGVKWTRGSNTGHNAGVTIVDYVTGTHLNIMSKGMQREHNQDGTHDNTKVAMLAGSQTFTGQKTFTSPKVITDISDTNGNEVLKITATSSAVNEVTVANAATGNAPSLASSGGDTNIDLRLIPKGTGNVKRGTSGGAIDWWEELGRTTLSGTSDTISVTGIPARKYLKYRLVVIASGTIDTTLRFNNDSGSNYAYRQSVNGAADTTSVSQSSISTVGGGVTSTMGHGEGEIINIATSQKGMLYKSSNHPTVGTDPNRIEGSATWGNTTDQITRIDAINTQTGDFAAGSELVVLGHD